jgi:RNA-directed DNA polymerase
VLVHGTQADAQALREEIARVLAPLGLRLSPAKTRIVHMSEAFEFLGFRIQWKRKRGSAEWHVYTFIASRPIRSLKAKIRALTYKTSQQNPSSVLIRLNQIMRGSPRVVWLWHDVAPDAQRRAFATRLDWCGARCRC